MFNALRRSLQRQARSGACRLAVPSARVPRRQFFTVSSPFSYTRTYRGPLQAAVLDWSGTCADNWVIAPAYAFVEVFNKHRVPITMNQARIPMGLRKDLHIKALTEVPEIAQQWKQVYGRLPVQKDVDAMFADFIPAQMACLKRYTGLIPGTVETVNTLRSKYGLKIGASTGFQRVMVDVLLVEAKKQGYVPDVAIAGDEATMPRPYPYMVFQNMVALGVMNVASVLKVDDTVGGIGEGLNAGTWTCGLSHTSTYMNINSYEEFEAMSKAEFEERGARARDILLKVGCHYVVNDITGLPAVVAEINQRLARGEKP